MKATIDIPDDLYRRVEEQSALQGLPVDTMVAKLISRGLDETLTKESGTADQQSTAPSGLTRRQRLKQIPTPEWIERLRQSSEEAFRDVPPGPTARDILEQDRSRLDRR